MICLDFCSPLVPKWLVISHLRTQLVKASLCNFWKNALHIPSVWLFNSLIALLFTMSFIVFQMQLFSNLKNIYIAKSFIELVSTQDVIGRLQVFPPFASVSCQLYECSLRILEKNFLTFYHLSKCSMSNQS